jgi:hypothetical protein
MLRDTGHALQCTYEGQRQKRGRGVTYVRPPEEWDRSSGKAEVSFEWSEVNPQGHAATEQVSVRVDHLFERGVPEPRYLMALRTYREAREKLQSDFEEGHSHYRNVWRGCVAAQSPRRTGWLWDAQTRRWCEAIVCAEEKDMPMKAGPGGPRPGKCKRI